MKQSISCNEIAELINEKLKESEEYRNFMTKDLNLKSKIMEIALDKTKHAEILLKLYPSTCKNTIKFPQKTPVNFNCTIIDKKITDENKGIIQYDALVDKTHALDDNSQQSVILNLISLDTRKHKAKLMVMKKDMGCEKNHH